MNKFTEYIIHIRYITHHTYIIVPIAYAPICILISRIIHKFIHSGFVGTFIVHIISNQISRNRRKESEE